MLVLPTKKKRTYKKRKMDTAASDVTLYITTHGGYPLKNEKVSPYITLPHFIPGIPYTTLNYTPLYCIGYFENMQQLGVLDTMIADKINPELAIKAFLQFDQCGILSNRIRLVIKNAKESYLDDPEDSLGEIRKKLTHKPATCDENDSFEMFKSITGEDPFLNKQSLLDKPNIDKHYFVEISNNPEINIHQSEHIGTFLPYVLTSNVEYKELLTRRLNSYFERVRFNPTKFNSSTPITFSTFALFLFFLGIMILELK